MTGNDIGIYIYMTEQLHILRISVRQKNNQLSECLQNDISQNNNAIWHNSCNMTELLQYDRTHMIWRNTYNMTEYLPYEIPPRTRKNNHQHDRIQICENTCPFVSRKSCVFIDLKSTFQLDDKMYTAIVGKTGKISSFLITYCKMFLYMFHRYLIKDLEGWMWKSSICFFIE